MRRRNSIIILLSVVSAIVLAGGCQNATNSSPAGSAPATDVSSAPSDSPKASKTEEDKIAEAMAALSEEDRKLAMSQKICPVSEAPLGSMSGMTKVNVNGRDVFICCGGCEEFLQKEPEKYLAKLPPAPAK